MNKRKKHFNLQQTAPAISLFTVHVSFVKVKLNNEKINK